MARQLAIPEVWIAPMLRQAWADFLVADALLGGFEPQVHEGPPYDAALDKFQQSLEKALKAVALKLVPERSDLAFQHFLLTDETLARGDTRQAKKIRDGFKKIFQLEDLFSGGGILCELERLAPDPVRAGLDDHGRIKALPENSQYPFSKGKRVVCPCDEFLNWDQRILNIRLELRTLFRRIGDAPEFSPYRIGLNLESRK